MQTLNEVQITEKDMTEIEMFNISQKPFFENDTEYKRIKALEESTFYIKPTSYFIGNISEGKYINKNYTLVPGKAEGQGVSIKKVLRKLFEMPFVFFFFIIYGIII